MLPKTLTWTLLAASRVSSAMVPLVRMSVDNLPVTASKPKMHNVYLYDDSFNMREYVARVLMMVCELSESQASQVMMEAHWEIRALIGTWEEPVAKHICEGLTQKGLSSETSPVDDIGDA